MKKVILGALIAFFMVSCNQEEIKRLTFQRDSIQQVKDQTEAEMNNYLSVIAEVQSNIKSIKETELGIIDNVQGAEGVNNESKERISQDLQTINEAIKNSKNQIAQLESDLKSAKGQAAKFKGIVAGLKSDLKKQAEEIAELKTQLEAKDIKIKELDDALASIKMMKDSLDNVSVQQAAAIKAQDEELNTAWYIIGTKKELKAKGLKEGDLKTAKVNKSTFTKVDIREFSGMELGSKKAKLYTSHPQSSYSLTKKSASDKNLVFKISDYSAFWGNSRILVIQIN
ncbi:MAG TPA: hypothetical protein PLN63_05450 [Paludibacteraceae bacterium]|jgi:chromosome segregation ATPase|nr:hypothetical protein [Paludibacteraceae bacterium]HOU67107.1 hypothetical protein [Paludibacteraceae bacterium]HPH63045.1 hypothetical protein [Paludibacteraceae bacterium]HQF49279.1 hypothetical protein [Paludibacteraceae bacterium]